MLDAQSFGNAYSAYTGGKVTIWSNLIVPANFGGYVPSTAP